MVTKDKLEFNYSRRELGDSCFYFKALFSKGLTQKGQRLTLEETGRRVYRYSFKSSCNFSANVKLVPNKKLFLNV